MIKIAICDDEERDRIVLYEWLQKYIVHRKNLLKESGSYQIRNFASGNQLLASGYPADILLLDIVMNDKERDGIQIGAEFRKRRVNAIIIYTTKLHDRINLAVNQVHAFGYLIKPVRANEVMKLMDDAFKILLNNPDSDIVTFLSEDNAIIQLPVKEIYYFEYDNRKVKIVTEKKTYICVKEKIGDIAKRMEKYAFAMSHQSFVVNLYKVEKIAAQVLIMKNGDHICLAQKSSAVFRKQLMQIAKES